MGLLKSVDNVPGVDQYEYRDSLYYNKHNYRLRMNIPCVRYSWYCKNASDLDAKIKGTGPSWSRVREHDKDTVAEHYYAITSVIELQNEKKKNKKFGIRLEGECATFFSNELSVLQTIEKKIGTQYKLDVTQAQTSQYAGIKHFVDEPKHKYRVYLKSRRVDDNLHVELGELFKRTKNLYPSPALSYWIDPRRRSLSTWAHRWTSAAHFIDYDDESTLSYLAIMHNDIIGKKYKLEKRPDNI